MMLFLYSTGYAQISGAIFTTLSDGTRVNANIYGDLGDVYLDGGPGPNAPQTAAGLPDGNYYFQVTDPSGKTLLSQDAVECREFTVEGGIITGYVSGNPYSNPKAKGATTCKSHLTGVDVGHNAVTIQLMPYAKTPNKGSVYKVWATPVEKYQTGGGFHGFIPSCSKTDNFKVLRYVKGPQVPSSTIDVRKFHDRNANGLQDLRDEELSGWPITVREPLGVTNIYYTPLLTPLLLTILDPSLEGAYGTYVIREEVGEGWKQTAPSNPNYFTATVSQAGGETFGPFWFGNVMTGDITACKFYDINRNGVQDDAGQDDAGEVSLSNWPMTLGGTDIQGNTIDRTGVTGDGCITFTRLLEGSYTVTEKTPDLTLYPGWANTTPTSVTIVLGEGAHGMVSFGNVCFYLGGGLTWGYWKTHTGTSAAPDDSTYGTLADDPIKLDGIIVVASPGDADYVFAGAGDYPANCSGDCKSLFRAQLLALLLNLRKFSGLEDALYQPLDSDPYAGRTIQDIANMALVALSANWTNYTAFQTTLDRINNNAYIPTVVKPSPCVY